MLSSKNPLLIERQEGHHLYFHPLPGAVRGPFFYFLILNYLVCQCLFVATMLVPLSFPVGFFLPVSLCGLPPWALWLPAPVRSPSVRPLSRGLFAYPEWPCKIFHASFLRVNTSENVPVRCFRCSLAFKVNRESRAKSLPRGVNS
jgi:hypothetical protein